MFTFGLSLAGGGGGGVPARSDEVLMLLNTQNRVDGRMRWAINNISWEAMATGTPFLAAMKYGLMKGAAAHPPPRVYYGGGSYNIHMPPANANAKMESSVYTFAFNSTVDVVLQNANTLTPNNSEVHPWHLHGHEFWVLGYGEGVFDPARHTATFNTKNPPLRNTVPLFPYGWTAIRFIANNPGNYVYLCIYQASCHDTRKQGYWYKVFWVIGYV